MFNQAILPDTLRALQLAAKIPVITHAYLAGGTALALQLGHRVSVDLDFFTSEEFDQDELEISLSQFPKFNLHHKAWRTIKGNIGITEFSLFYYKYPLIEKTVSFEAIQMASLKDIAAMKIHALSERGTKRDFIDVYFLSQNFSLEEMLDLYNQKYSGVDEKAYHILRALDYFEDAEYDDRHPTMLIDVDWNKIKAFFHTESTRLAKTRLGI